MDDYEAMVGRDVYDDGGEKIGTVDALYVSDDSDEPLFATVKTGWFSGSSFVPLVDAKMDDARIVVPYSKDMVKDAPNIEQDRQLSSDEEDQLYSYYGMGDGRASASDDTAYDDEDQHEYDMDEEDADDTMVRSEEELDVDTRTEETGRYRLRKHVVTENVTKTVPVQHEEVRVEREPIMDRDREDDMDGDLSEEEREVVTHAEVPTVDKKVVPKERVRLEKDTVNDEEAIDEEVRKERIDLDEDDRR